MENAIDKGSFVLVDTHPQSGVGRIVAINSFMARVVFATRGLRVYSAGDVELLRNAPAPAADVIAALDAQETTFARGGVADERVKK